MDVFADLYQCQSAYLHGKYKQENLLMTGFLYTDKLLNQISLKKYKNGTLEITRYAYEKRAEFVILQY